MNGTPLYWPDAKRHLSRSDRVLGRLIEAYPDIEVRRRGNAFQALSRSIVGQQISVKAAQAIWKRFADAAGTVTPANVVAMSPETLRACGLSSQKSAYIHDLAARFGSGALRSRRWSRMDDEAVIADLVQVKGIGRWSVEMFLMFYMMRPNVLPVGDLGLQRAMERHYNKGEALTREDMRAIGEPWRPWSSVATWYLWRSLEP